MGSAWTNIRMRHEAELKQTLAVPETITIAALLPVAYYTGADF